MNNLYILFIITNYTNEKQFIKFINEYKLGFKTILHGKGTASSSLLEYFGLNEEEKTIINSVLPLEICKKILINLETKMKFNEHGKGIAFTIPLSSSTKYMLDFYQIHELEDSDMEETKNHLIITIVNKGYAEKVMTEAKKGGATGGTTLNGRGLETEKAIKFLKIEIEPEKDVVMILVSTDKKNKVMTNILENCGLKTPGAGICFSLPVDHVVGLNNHKNQ